VVKVEDVVNRVLKTLAAGFKILTGFKILSGFRILYLYYFLIYKYDIKNNTLKKILFQFFK